jgi:hypothetical protein
MRACYLIIMIHVLTHVSERAAAKKQLFCDLCDICVPVSGLGWVGFLDDGIVGLTGTLSSLIGVYGQWKKTAA